jgi:hypothetical protein
MTLIFMNPQNSSIFANVGSSFSSGETATSKELKRF